MNRTITKYVEVDVDVDASDFIEDMTDSDLEEHGLKRIAGADDRDSITGIMRAIHEHHEKSHQSNSMLACPAEPCTSLSTSEVWSIEEARASRWGQD